MTMLTDPFFLTAWLAGIGIALMSAPIGCFIAWQRLVYFGDTVAHAALLGVVLALSFNLLPVGGIVLMAVMIALLVAHLQDDFLLPADSLLGILSHASLALGVVILSLSPDITLDVNGLLFGDILAASHAQVGIIFTAALALLAIITLRWRALMRYVLHPDIAAVEGTNVHRIRLLLMLMIALTVAISIKLVGILLITSLLILPATSGRLLAHSPRQMIIWAVISSVAAVTLGLAASLHFDTPAGATIVLAALLILLCVSCIKRR
jgi:zinc transport system permease protein